MAGLVVRPRARILRGHDWIYASEVLKTFGDPRDGEVISLKDGRDRLLGVGIYNSVSQIVARRISRRRQALDLGFFQRRIVRAVSWRERSGCRPDLVRLIWSEADGLPGVIADRYGDVVVLQTLTRAMDDARRLIAECLAELPGVVHVVERNDAPVRTSEGLEGRTGMLVGGDPGERSVEACGVRSAVNFLDGHKTGLYLDQLENMALVAAHAGGLRVLDCFANQGGFALACKAAGAASVTAVESGAEAVRRLEANAAHNGLEVSAIREDVFDVLPAMQERGDRFDLIVLDPPSFTRTHNRRHEALRGYEELHRLAAPLLTPGGLLATFSCSHHVSDQSLLGAIARGFARARCTAHVLTRLGQPPDHPVALHIPETAYLKGFLLAARPEF